MTLQRLQSPETDQGIFLSLESLRGVGKFSARKEQKSSHQSVTVFSKGKEKML